jgi:hypothetical protein
MKYKLSVAGVLVLILATVAWAQIRSGIYQVVVCPAPGTQQVMGNVVGFSCVHGKDGDTCYALVKAGE